ncbi:PIN-like domain-containing protein [Neisseria zoodegmatis]|uniref:PIN like domain-containing protein n=1 Tax=Neisseria zoodegmatis TaxID=326523 RepID=A0AB38DRS0_9NEIS|nr:PIN domain-containing protein [Neisseria zoodegmatis]OSI11539.1 hypothetical protein BWD10_00795 [Neisseria zoodegmatis]SNU79910.1 Uncharacterised protein [Neisseria zoodegmatis]
MPSIKEEFKWAIPLTEEETKDIWENAVLTVDTNVLLDLYRYHKETRNSILNSLRLFEGRLWLSHQVATEFFRNRNKVISESEKQFENSKDSILNIISSKFSTIVSEMKGIRTIPKILKQELEIALQESQHKLADKINQLEWEKITYSENDDILEAILQLFGSDDCLGEPFPENELSDICEEAKRRIDNEIPPGYKDKSKENDREYGDFFLWEQILRHGVKVKKPLILITSERKEDWWEKISSRQVVGLRSELRKEAWERLKQPVLVLQTQRFIELAAQEKENQLPNQSLAEVVKEITQLHSDRENREQVEKLNWIFSNQEIDQFNFDNNRINRREKNNKNNLIYDVEQEILYSDEYSNIGYLICTVSRPTTRFTVSGRLKPHLRSIPKITVKLIDAPNDVYINPYARTGTLYDFNIHMNLGMNELIPPGRYVFKYFAYSTDTYSYDDIEEKVVDCPECGAPYLTRPNICTECEYESERDCVRCGAEILPSELEFAPLCGYCAYQRNKSLDD